MKTLLIIFILIPSIAFCGISTDVPKETNIDHIVVNARIIDLFPYIGNRVVTINKMPVDPFSDGVYSKYIKLKKGRNFITFLVKENDKRYSKTKRIEFKKQIKINTNDVNHFDSKLQQLYKDQFKPSTYSLNIGDKIDIYEKTKLNKYEDKVDKKNLELFFTFERKF